MVGLEKLGHVPDQRQFLDAFLQGLENLVLGFLHVGMFQLGPEHFVLHDLGAVTDGGQFLHPFVQFLQNALPGFLSLFTLTDLLLQGFVGRLKVLGALPDLDLEIVVGFAEFFVHLAFVQRDLDGGAETGFVERLNQITERLRFFGGLDQFLVSVSRQENDRGAVGLEDFFGGLDAVHLSLELDVHQDQFGTLFPDRGQRGLGGGDAFRNGIPDAFQSVFDVLGDNAFVFNDQDADFLHPENPRWILNKIIIGDPVKVKAGPPAKDA